MEPMTGFSSIIQKVTEREKKTVVVAAADDADVLAATTQARQEGIANFLYVGDEGKIRGLAQENNLDLGDSEIVNEADAMEAGKRAIELIKAGKGQVLMKGKIGTGQILGMVLKDEELKKKLDDPFLSHIAIFEWQNQLKVFSDAALNIAPDVEQKRRIALNAIHAAHKLGMETPRVAFLSAVEKVSPKMQSSVDGDELAKMEWENAIVGGPLAFDGAMFEEAYNTKGVPSPVEGRADVLVCPNIESGNVLYKTLTWMLKCDLAGVVTGSAVPFILTSRADSARVKFLSIVTTIFLAE